MDIRGLELFYSDMMNNATGIHNGFQSILVNLYSLSSNFLKL